ncbi:MAG: hypothetical protein JW839_22380 [Candidatus Lokiarchaeota archaeon]|nr:hypothetical protein [Candidatus Lokiarchaeota archaeon]
MVKAKLSDAFIELTNKDVVIDTSVYKEAVDDGIAQHHIDAMDVKKFLERYQIPSIPVDVSNDIERFKDAGETSCFLLARQEGICLTSDTRALKKYRNQGVSCMQPDIFFLTKYLEKKISEIDLERALDALMQVYATTPERKLEILTAIKKP